MSLLGIRVFLLTGPTLPIPAPPAVLDAVERIEVTQADDDRSAAQLVFRTGRSERDLIDDPLLAGPALAPGNRLILTVAVGFDVTVLFDGIITQQQLAPSSDPGETVLAVVAEDLTFAMDREERSVEHLGLTENLIAFALITRYATLGLVPVVIPPPVLDVPAPVDRVPVQQDTDLAYLRRMAARFDYVFTVTPGPAPGTSRAYWGPPERIGVPQRALTVAMGPDTNVHRLSLVHDAGEVTRVVGSVQDRLTNVSLPVASLPVSLRPPLATSPALLRGTTVGTRRYRARGARIAPVALIEAQAEQDRSTDVVRADGELDAVRYGAVLRAGGLVGLRGVGLGFDGLYHVRRVTHTLVPSGVPAVTSFSTRFSLRREGVGSTVPVVVP